MRRLLAGLVVILAVGACGGGGTDGGNAVPSAFTPPPVTNGELPAGSSVLFGSSYDPATLAVIDKSTKIKVGSPIVAVGRALAPVPMAGVTIQVGAGGSSKPPRPVTVADNPDNARYFAFDLTADALGQGTWIVSFVNANGRILASGNLNIIP